MHKAKPPYISTISPLYLHYISLYLPYISTTRRGEIVSSLYLPYISPVSPLYLPYLSTTLKPKWLRKPLQSALLAPFLDGLNGEI